MTIARAIFAFVIVLSVAVLPATGGVAVAGHPAAAPVVHCTHDMTNSSGQHGPLDHKMKRDCADMVACSIHCFDIYGPVNTNLDLTIFVATIEPSFPAHTFLPQMGHPPFRPPRA